MTLVRGRSVKEVAEFVQARVLGDESVQLTGISSVQSASPGDLVFVDDKKNLRAALESRAAAVVAGDFAAIKPSPKPLLLAAQPRLAFARAAQLLCPEPERKAGIHSSAIVDSAARLASNVTVEERVVIGVGATIGDGTRVGAGSVIGAKAIIGRNCNLYPNITIYPGVRLGDRVIVHSGAVLGSDGFGYVRDQATGRYEKFPQVGRLEIEDDVEIGANTTIDRGALDVTRIGRGAKIDNLVHIGHNCQIGEDVVVAAQTGLSGSTTIEKDVILGGQVGIGEHARIEEGVLLGGQGGVLPNKVLRGKGIAFWGTPAKPVREYLKELAALARLAKKE
jgi:UDP-3-O-[3-hydroxymyristoyl] glucosamine N-acyltransferase